MNQPLTEQLVALKIDVDQWRRDIQTFVDSTIQELHAINDELSSGFANGDSAKGNKESRSVDAGGSDFTKKNPNESRGDHAAPFTETQTDDRLAALKRKLSERVTTPGNNGATH